MRQLTVGREDSHSSKCRLAAIVTVGIDTLPYWLVEVGDVRMSHGALNALFSRVEVLQEAVDHVI